MANNGLLMPVLAMGSLAGACCAGYLMEYSIVGTEQREVILSLGMVAFFAGSVRAPLTGAALVTEMCGAWQCMPEILLTSLIATYMSNKIGSMPVYDSLRERIWNGIQAKAAAAGTPVTPTGTGVSSSKKHRTGGSKADTKPTGQHADTRAYTDATQSPAKSRAPHRASKAKKAKRAQRSKK